MKAILFAMTTISVFAASSLHELVGALPDYSHRVKLGLNSMPGKDEELIQKWVRINHPDAPFFIKVEYGAIVGNTIKGAPIKAAAVFVVNPSKTTGFFWWRKAKLHRLKEPDWTLFKEESKPLSDIDNEKLNSLFL